MVVFSIQIARKGVLRTVVRRAAQAREDNVHKLGEILPPNLVPSLHKDTAKVRIRHWVVRVLFRNVQSSLVQTTQPASCQ